MRGEVANYDTVKQRNFDWFQSNFIKFFVVGSYNTTGCICFRPNALTTSENTFQSLEKLPRKRFIKLQKCTKLPGIHRVTSTTSYILAIVYFLLILWNDVMSSIVPTYDYGKCIIKPSCQPFLILKHMFKVEYFGKMCSLTVFHTQVVLGRQYPTWF